MPSPLRTAYLIGWTLTLLAPLSVSTTFLNSDPEFIITQWQTDDGLPEGSATSIVQTDDGFLWVGTFNGLVRFDGRRMVVFDTSNTKDLPHDGIVHLHLDKTGAMWVSTLGGMVRMKQGVWKRFGTESGWRGNYVRHSAEAADGSLYFSTFDGLILQYRDDRFTEIPSVPPEWTPSPHRAKGSSFLLIDRAGRLLAGRGPVLAAWSGRNWERVPVPAELRALNTHPDTAAWGVAAGGVMLAVSFDTLFSFENGVTRKKIPLGIKGDVWSMTTLKDGTIWISTSQSGLIRVEPDGTVRRFRRTSGFVADSFRFAFPDREGNIWTGTNGSGLARLKPRRFLAWGESQGLPAVRTTSIATLPNGDRMIATYGGGLYRMHNGQIRNEPLPDPGPFLQTLLSANGRLWIGRFQASLLALSNGRFETVTPELRERRTVEALFEDSKKRIWIGGSDHAAVFENGKYTMLDVQSASGPVLICYFAEDLTTGQIWAAGDGGLYRVEGKTLVSVPDVSGRRLPPLRCIRPTRSGEMWLGSKANGLLRWRNGTITEIGERHGLTARNIGEMIEDSGSFWLATNQGVWRASLSDLEASSLAASEIGWQVFGEGDGLPSLECSAWHQPSAMKDSDGKLWFTTLKGLAVIDPKRLPSKPRSTSVVIQEVAYLDERHNEHRMALTAGSTVILPPRSHSVRLSFTALHLAAPESLLFHYVLRRNGDLYATGKSRDPDLTFHHMESGTFSLTVRVRNSDGVWSDVPAELKLVRQPGWTEDYTLLFSLAVVALVGAGVVAWWMMRSRLRRQLHEIEREREVASMKARLAIVLENTSDAVGFADPKGITVYLNRAAKLLVGLPETVDATGIPAETFYPERVWRRIMDEGLPYATTHGSWQGYTAALHRDGHEIPVWQVILVHRGPDGKPEFMSSISRDMTEITNTEQVLRQAKERAEEATKLKSEFLANMSHEIRTPMNGILGLTQLLLTSELAEEQRTTAQTIHLSAAALLKLLNDILDLSRIEAGRLDLVMRPFDLREAIAATLSLIRPMAQQKGVTLEHSFPPDLPPILEGDSIRVRQIVLNYLDNAIKFTDSGSIVLNVEELSRESRAVRLRISVTDTGRGIPPSKVPFLFDKFTQVDSSNTRSYGGAGLGLSITKRLAEMMDGSVGVESSPGHGSTFWVELPFAVAPEIAEQAYTATVLQPATPDPPRVLVVEDNQINRLVADRLLRKLGCVVEVAHNGNEALQKATANSYDVILMDVHMPGMDGLEATRLIRSAEQSGQHCPIVALTASAMDEDRARCLRAGMDDFFVKPVQLEDLHELLRRHVHSSRIDQNRGSSPG